MHLFILNRILQKQDRDQKIGHSLKIPKRSSAISTLSLYLSKIIFLLNFLFMLHYLLIHSNTNLSEKASPVACKWRLNWPCNCNHNSRKENTFYVIACCESRIFSEPLSNIRARTWQFRNALNLIFRVSLGFEVFVCILHTKRDRLQPSKNIIGFVSYVLSWKLVCAVRHH